MEPNDLADDFDLSKTQFFPVCCRFDRRRYFYLELGRRRSGRWIAFVIGNVAEEEGFRVGNNKKSFMKAKKIISWAAS